MTYEFDTYCENKATSKPIRLSLNISNKGAINNTTIFIKDNPYTYIQPKRPICWHIYHKPQAGRIR